MLLPFSLVRCVSGPVVTLHLVPLMVKQNDRAGQMIHVRRHLPRCVVRSIFPVESLPSLALKWPSYGLLYGPLYCFSGARGLLSWCLRVCRGWERWLLENGSVAGRRVFFVSVQLIFVVIDCCCTDDLPLVPFIIRVWCCLFPMTFFDHCVSVCVLREQEALLPFRFMVVKTVLRTTKYCSYCSL